MGWLETTKSAHHDNEAITNEIVAQAHLENYALKLFTYADQQDRAANFNKYTIHSQMIYHSPILAVSIMMPFVSQIEML